MRGAAFAPGRAAVINAAGQLDAAQGNLSDCVLVDGSSAPCGTASNGAVVVYSETPLQSTTLNYTLAFPPQPAASLVLFRNGLLMTNLVDYTLTGTTISFYAASAPQTGDILTASYQYSTTGQSVGNQTAPNAPEVLCNGGGAVTGSTSLALLGTCNIAANKMAAGDRVEIKFALTHQGAGSGFSPAIYWGGTALVQRALNPSDSAVTGETSILVASDGTLSHFTSSVAAGGLPLMTNGTAAGNIQNINTIAFDALLSRTGTQDSVTLRYYTVTRYPAPQ
jgi:hypothetical protein